MVCALVGLKERTEGTYTLLDELTFAPRKSRIRPWLSVKLRPETWMTDEPGWNASIDIFFVADIVMYEYDMLCTK